MPVSLFSSSTFVGLAEKFLLDLLLLLIYRSKVEAVDHGVIKEVLRDSKHRPDTKCCPGAAAVPHLHCQ